MKNKKVIIIIVVAFVVLLGGATILYNHLKDKVDSQQLAETKEEEKTEDEAGTEESTDEGDAAEEEKSQAAPDFTVYDADGTQVHLSDYHGKPVVLNFWASWCGPCKSELPDFEAAFKEYGDQIQFMMINLTDGTKETMESASALIEEQGYTFPVFYDTTYDAAGQYVNSGIPITYFIDAEGNFVAYGQGALDAETLQSGIDMLFK